MGPRLFFWLECKRPSFWGGLTFKNRGHWGSKVYIFYIYIYIVYTASGCFVHLKHWIHICWPGSQGPPRASRYKWSDMVPLLHWFYTLVSLGIFHPYKWSYGPLLYTPPKFNIAHEKLWLEDYFPIGKVTFEGRTVKLREGNYFFGPTLVKPSILQRVFQPSGFRLLSPSTTQWILGANLNSPANPEKNGTKTQLTWGGSLRMAIGPSFWGLWMCFLQGFVLGDLR